MAAAAIASIEIDSDGRLLVRPRSRTYEFIYRAATGVHWDAKEQALVGPPPKKWSYVDWYENIVSSVESEYADKLVISQKADWINVPDHLRAAIESL